MSISSAVSEDEATVVQGQALVPKVVCVLLNYHQPVDTKETIDSLAEMNAAENFEVILVDNASTEQSVAELKDISSMPFSLIKSERNAGFTGGNNIGIERALASGADYVWLLNNDVFVDKDCLQELRSAALQTGAGVVGSLIYYHPARDVVWYGGGKVYKPFYVVEHLLKGQKKGEFSLPDKPIETEFITGCSMLIKRELLEKLHGLNDDFFIYGEDLDFSLKAKKLGYSLYLQPKSVLWHKVSQASGGEFSPVREYYYTRNGFLVVRGNIKNKAYRLLAYAARSVWDFYRMAKSSMKRGASPFEALKIYRKAVGDFNAGHLGQAPKELFPKKK